MRARLQLILSATLVLTLQPSAAHAQLDAFVRAVRDVADAAGQPEPSRSNGIRAAASRMATALEEWDRQIRALEARADQGRHVELGVSYRTRGRISDALREFDAAVAVNPSSSDVQLLRALTLEPAGRAEEAGKAFRAAWNLDARNPVKAYYVAQRTGTGSAADRGRARALLTDTYRNMVTGVGTSADRFPSPSPLPFMTLGAIPDNLSRTPIVADQATVEGFTRLRAGQYGDAVAALERASPADSGEAGDSPLAHFARGQRDEAQNRVADARREYQAALAGTVAGRSVLLVGLARLALVDGDPAGAIDAFARAVQLNPNDPNIHKELASAYAAEGRADEAFAELIAALLINPRDAQAHASIGQLYLDAGRNAEAVVALNRALTLMPQRYETRYALATAYTRLGDAAEAARQLELFDRARRDALDRRRRDTVNEVEREEALRK